jgi:hypothetical protein
MISPQWENARKSTPCVLEGGETGSFVLGGEQIGSCAFGRRNPDGAWEGESLKGRGSLIAQIVFAMPSRPDIWSFLVVCMYTRTRCHRARDVRWRKYFKFTWAQKKRCHIMNSVWHRVINSDEQSHMCSLASKKKLVVEGSTSTVGHAAAAPWSRDLLAQ